MKRSLALIGILALGGCAMTPAYHVPAMSMPPSFKEVQGWQAANPSDGMLRQDWWAMFGDTELSRLETLVVQRNQTVAGAVAAYDQALAVVRESRAALLPTVNGSVGASTSGGTGSSGSTSNATTPGARYTAGLGATWEPDLFGGLRAGLSQSHASAQAQRATLGNVILAAQAELASDYVQLRGLDAQSAAYATTIDAYRRALGITQNRYKVGVAARSDVLQAQTTLANAEAAAIELVRQRKVFEHAIAVLAGSAPAELSIGAAAWRPVVPQVPLVLPSTLLERRPDIAAAERNVAAANAGIGVQRAAFFPNFGISAGLNQNAAAIGSLFSLGTSLWSLGLTSALTLLDFGARSAKVAQARATFDQAAANYRQTVLTAFQQVEDRLSSTVLLASETRRLQDAAAASARAEQIAMNQYLGGLTDYTTVVTAQSTALAARRAAISATVNQQLNAISLSQALGGGWAGTVPPQK